VSDANFVIDHLSAKQMENGFDRVERANVARDVDSDFRIISKPLGVRHFEEVPTATNGRRFVRCSLGLVSMAYSLYVTTEPIFASSKPEFTLRWDTSTLADPAVIDDPDKISMSARQAQELGRLMAEATRSAMPKS